MSIKDLRISKGLTQKEAAEIVGLSLRTYQNYEYEASTRDRFKIDNIIIHREYYRNYKLDDKELDEFILIKELTDEEFYPIEVLIHSNYRYPSIIIDVHKHMHDVFSIVNTIKNKESEVKKLTYDIHNLEKQLFIHMTQ